MDATLAAWIAAAAGPDETFVDDLWLRVLRRPVDAEARERALTELRLGVSRAELLHRLVSSSEFARVRLLDDAVAWAAAERRKGARPRGLRAPGDGGPEAIALPWCLARYGGEQRLLVLGSDEPALLSAVAAPHAGASEGGVELVIALAPFDAAEIARRLTRDGRVLYAGVPETASWEAAGLLVYEEERYARGDRDWGAVDTDGTLLCAELRPDRLATRLRRAVRR